MNYLAIDYGLSNIGLAYSEGHLAEPLVVIKNTPFVTNYLQKLCRDRQIGKIIIGLPEGELGQKARQFGAKLKAALNLPVAYQDETLTSHDALAKMIASGRSMKYRRERQDAIAAAIILQEYLAKKV